MGKVAYMNETFDIGIIVDSPASNAILTPEETIVKQSHILNHGGIHIKDDRGCFGCDVVLSVLEFLTDSELADMLADRLKPSL